LTGIVLDCSITIAWCFENEKTSKIESVIEMLDRCRAVVPSIWPLEVLNVMLVAERHHRITEAQTTRYLSLLHSLPITTDDVSDDQSIGRILSLGREHGLSSYDATYLELAEREGFPLATLDKKLQKAALHCGVRVLP
jgi:predicted nucleic acid-binding protein